MFWDFDCQDLEKKCRIEQPKGKKNSGRFNANSAKSRRKIAEIFFTWSAWIASILLSFLTKLYYLNIETLQFRTKNDFNYILNVFLVAGVSRIHQSLEFFKMIEYLNVRRGIPHVVLRPLFMFRLLTGLLHKLYLFVLLLIL